VSIEDIQAFIVPGRCLRLWCKFTRPAKEKFFLVAATEPFLIGFLINSEATSLQQQRPDLLRELISLPQGGFLTHQSYLDCTCAISDFEMDEVCAQISADPGRMLTVASPEVMHAIRIIVEGSLMIEGGNRKIILKNIDQHFPVELR
jgi:hypothetical protein